MSSGNGSGGGIFNANSGTLTVTRSSFFGNSAGYRGGALRNGGTATIETSTFTQNTAANQGGAIVNHEKLTITNSTIAFNDSGLAGGGIRNANDGTIDLGNTIIADNTSGNPRADCSNAGTFNSHDYNLDSDGSCPLGMANDISNGNADLQAPDLNWWNDSEPITAGRPAATRSTPDRELARALTSAVRFGLRTASAISVQSRLSHRLMSATAATPARSRLRSMVSASGRIW